MKTEQAKKYVVAEKWNDGWLYTIDQSSDSTKIVNARLFDTPEEAQKYIKRHHIRYDSILELTITIEPKVFHPEHTPQKTKEENEAEFQYLEQLRQSGITDMFGATPYLCESFDISKEDARNILAEWMSRYEELAEKYGWQKPKKGE